MYIFKFYLIRKIIYEEQRILYTSMIFKPLESGNKGKA